MTENASGADVRHVSGKTCRRSPSAVMDARASTHSQRSSQRANRVLALASLDVGTATSASACAQKVDGRRVVDRRVVEPLSFFGAAFRAQRDDPLRGARDDLRPRASVGLVAAGHGGRRPQGWGLCNGRVGCANRAKLSLCPRGCQGKRHPVGNAPSRAPTQGLPRASALLRSALAGVGVTERMGDLDGALDATRQPGRAIDLS
jgi:hypothetical protein